MRDPVTGAVRDKEDLLARDELLVIELMRCAISPDAEPDSAPAM